ELELTGEWVAERFAALETGLASVDLAAAQQLSIGTRRLTALDLSGAWVLRRFVRRARAAGAAVRFLGTQPDQLRLLDETLKEDGLGGGGRSPAPAGPRQLANLGADIYVVDLVTIGVLRELGVLLTAIIVAGRSGSAFAAELGSMRLNEEVDALTATAVDPFEVLVVPRVLGLVIALP